MEPTLRVNAWWYAHRRAPAKAVLLRDPDGIIYSYRAGQGFAFNPVGTAGRWQRLNEGFTATQLATTLLGMGVVDQRGGRRVMSWEYFDVPGEPRTIRPGVSGMAQSRLAQLMANAYRDSGDPTFAAAATDAMASMSVAVDEGGSRSMVAYPAGSAQAPWFVERAYPREDPWTGAALNGFMVAILELRGAERALRDPPVPTTAGDAAADEARALADEGAATLDRLPAAPRLRTMELLRPPHPRPAVANLHRERHLPLLPRGAVAGARRRLPGHALRRDRRHMERLRRHRRGDLPDELRSTRRRGKRPRRVLRAIA